MPTLFILNGWKIQMFVDENEEPHFHVWLVGEQYRFRLRDFSQMRTDYTDAPAKTRSGSQRVGREEPRGPAGCPRRAP